MFRKMCRSYVVTLIWRIKISKLTKTIEKHKIPMVCVNDSNYAIDFEKVQKEINGALEQRLSRKSLFEM